MFVVLRFLLLSSIIISFNTHGVYKIGVGSCGVYKKDKNGDIGTFKPCDPNKMHVLYPTNEFFEKIFKRKSSKEMAASLVKAIKIQKMDNVSENHKH